MKIGFNVSGLITNPEDLFGRSNIFKQLIALANRKSNVQVIGLRRFGKTSLLKCLETYLRSDNNSKVYPIFIDFKEVGSSVKGTGNVYRYLIANIVARLTFDKLFTEPEMFRNQTIKPSLIWEDIYRELQEVDNVRMPGLFEEIISLFSDLIEKTVLCLFDEYEYLFRFSFDSPTGFMPLRNFTSKVTSRGFNPFTFFISGVNSWEHLCTITGSGELNCIDQNVFVTPIDYDSFLKMWVRETSLIVDCPIDVVHGGEYAYKASGGVPFYGKIIGSNWLISSRRPDEAVLKSYFKEILDSITIEEKQLLNNISNRSKNFKNSNYVKELIEKGLIKKNRSTFEIKIGFLNDYIRALSLDTIPKTAFLEESELLTDRISKLITVINNTQYNKKGSFIFEPVNDDAALLRDLRTPCYTLDQFSDFASSLYKILFERTKENINGRSLTKAKLPTNFKEKNQFIEIVDIMRHSLGGGHLMATFTPRAGLLSKSKMLEILTGSKNEPNTPDEFSNLQIAVLKLFETELNNLNLIVRNMP